MLKKFLDAFTAATQAAFGWSAQGATAPEAAHFLTTGIEQVGATQLDRSDTPAGGRRRKYHHDRPATSKERVRALRERRRAAAKCNETCNETCNVSIVTPPAPPLRDDDDDDCARERAPPAKSAVVNCRPPSDRLERLADALAWISTARN